LWYLVKPEGPVDVDAHVTGDAQVGQGLEMGGPLLDEQDTEPAAGGSPGDGADREHTQHRRDRSSDAPISAAGSERSTIGEH
jgi:hypothetical protein